MSDNINDYFISEEKENINNEEGDYFMSEEKEDNNYDDILEQISKGSNNISDFIKANISNYNDLITDDIVDNNLEKFKPVTISFIIWMKENKNNDNLYKTFSNIYSPEYRTSLYDNIIKYFNNDTVITDEFLIYWKLLVIDLIKNSKRYKHNIKNININLDENMSNLRLDIEKGIFKCYIDNDSICYFKENGNDYYVS
ncbi:hypothetical protein QJ854_gp553 [Moumouvirus goulette]|uniref:Uncharacterized protein n=1 Tax=Moumouvirus goulette TaxID=1247379 RepID=M1PBD7_9VIRU|nr:hypothetical protein QJ854_gp553 [Moumouvirus goulette]AGF85229.1 hypothetical protein glt_00420 [Moumouvirus goulette]